MQHMEEDNDKARNKAVRRVLAPNYDAASKLKTQRKLRGAWHLELQETSSREAMSFIARHYGITVEEAVEKYGKLTTEEMNRSVVDELLPALVEKRDNILAAVNVSATPVAVSPRSWPEAELAEDISLTRVLANEHMEPRPRLPREPPAAKVMAKPRLRALVPSCPLGAARLMPERLRRASLDNLTIPGLGSGRRTGTVERQPAAEPTEKRSKRSSVHVGRTGVRQGRARMSVAPNLSLALRLPEHAPCFFAPTFDLSPKEDKSPTIDPANPTLEPVSPFKLRRYREPVNVFDCC